MSAQTDSKHVAEHMRVYLDIDGEQRISASWKDIWVDTSETKRAIKALDFCLGETNSTKPDGLSFTGVPDAGKSYLFEHYCQTKKIVNIDDHEYDQCPAICVLAPPKPDFPALLEAILEQLGVPAFYNQEARSLQRYTEKMVGKCGVKLIIIDELFDIEGSGRILASRTDFMRALKGFINKTGRPFVASGVPVLIDVLQKDAQITTRFENAIQLKALSGKEFARAANSFVKQIPLREPSNFLKNSQLVALLYLQSGGLIGSLSRILKRASRLAILSKTEKLTAQIVKDAVNSGIRTSDLRSA